MPDLCLVTSLALSLWLSSQKTEYWAMRVPLVGENGCCGGQDYCCSEHVCREVGRDLCPPGLFPAYSAGKHVFLGIQSCVWVGTMQLVEKNALLPLSGNVMNG